MKLSQMIKIAVISVVAVIALGLVLWTITSPVPLSVQSESELQSGLFGISKTTAAYNISDGSGTYRFEFGLDYSQNLTSGSATKVAVYCALVGQEITSFFTRGVALTLQGTSLSIDGSVDSSTIVSSKVQSNLETYYFQIQDVSSSIGNHALQIRILVSTIDVNYIGNAMGSYQAILLNGTFTVSP